MKYFGHEVYQHRYINFDIMYVAVLEVNFTCLAFHTHFHTSLQWFTLFICKGVPTTKISYIPVALSWVPDSGTQGTVAPTKPYTFVTINRVRQQLTTQAAESIYKSMIRLLITYSDLIMLCLSESKVTKLERLQDRAETSVFGKACSGKWPSLQSERHRKAALFAYKCIHGLTPDVFKDYFEKVNHGKELEVMRLT